MEPTYDGATGTAGGPAFGAALAALAAGRELDAAGLAAATGLEPAFVTSIFQGTARASIAVLARFAQALRVRAIEFMQKAELLSLDVYAGGLDPLYFLPDGQLRYDARIYMREINPRHAVPEGDMTKRNPLLKTLADDAVLDPLGKLEIELTYLLRAAVQHTGGTL
jgi:transcriptional regulator with XRE-family HTH domain